MSKARMLTTTDNPYNPYTEWDSWLAFDREKKHFTNEYLARIVVSSPDLSEQEEEEAIDLAIDEILELNINGLYITINENGEKSNQNSAE